MSTQTIAQQRAKHALGKITDYMLKQADAQKRFNSYVAGLGPMILMSGFGQACAFYYANKKGEHRDVIDILDDWLQQSGRPFQNHKKDGSYIMARIVKCDMQEYRIAQVEALVYLDWLKKFAKAFLKSEDDNSSDKQKTTPLVVEERVS